MIVAAKFKYRDIAMSVRDAFTNEPKIWVVPVFLAVAGISNLVGDRELIGLFCLFISILASPPVRFLVVRSFHFKHAHSTILIAVVIFGSLSLFEINKKQKSRNLETIRLEEREREATRIAALRAEFETHRQAITANIVNAISESRFQDALAKAAIYSDLENTEIDRLAEQAKDRLNKQKEEKRVTQQKENIRKQREITTELYNEVRSFPAKELEMNRDGYRRLLQMEPGNKLYQSKLNHYESLIFKELKEKIAKSIRNPKLDSNFSGWDGSHHGLKRLVKNAMRDPKSFEHINTSYVDMGSYLIVTMNYRGRNGFGGMAVETIRARVSLDGQVLEVL